MGCRHQLKAAVALVLVLGACQRPEPEQESTMAAVDAGAPAIVIPRDRLGANELLEGSDKAYALPLPRGIQKVLVVDKTIDARGPGQQPDVTTYIQARTSGGKLLRGVHSSDFKQVFVPAEPARLLDIHVEQARGDVLTNVEVIDVTPVKPVVVPAAEAYKVNGLTPDGKLADPQHMQ